MLIAFTGWTEVGKTTCAKYLMSEYEFVRRSFATEIRRVTAAIGRISVPQTLADPSFKSKKSAFGDMSWRDVMVKVGTFVREELDPLYFVDALDISGKNVVVDDLRTVSEYEFLRKANATIVRINSSRVKAPYGSLDTRLEDAKFDIVLDNSGDFEILYDKLDQIPLLRRRSSARPKSRR